MKVKTKNAIIFILFSILIGAIAGFLVWLFFKIMNLGINLIWHQIPDYVQIPFYTLIICTLGGLLIGIWQKKTKGKYPENLEVVMKKVKKDGGYEYKKLPTMCVSAMLPLLVGASVGPEAGLTGVIAGLCTWVGDKFKTKFKELKELTQIGISATLGVIFSSPLFGFIEPIESEEETKLPKASKIIVYFMAILGALGIFVVLNSIFTSGSGMPRFSDINIETYEWLYLLPFALIGALGGILYQISDIMMGKSQDFFDKYRIISCTLSGLILGIVGTILPYTMFSGEEQINELMGEWTSIAAIVLLFTGFVKILLTNVCIHMGLKGGHFFPIIFAGVSLGYALSVFTGVDQVFSITIITSGLVSSVMRKPLATVMLLMLCFPIDAIIPMTIAAIIGGALKVPKRFIEKESLKCQ